MTPSLIKTLAASACLAVAGYGGGYFLVMLLHAVGQWFLNFSFEPLVF